MKIKSSYRSVKRISLTIIVIVTLAIMLTSVSSANVRSTIPPDPYAPIYADWYGNGESVAFIFYRSPSCVPSDFNLLNFFDTPPTPFLCPLTIDGFVIYKNPDEFVPIQGKLGGLGAVPIWFISWEDYNNAKSDHVIGDGRVVFLILTNQRFCSFLYRDSTYRRAFSNAHEKHRGIWHAGR